MRAAAHNLRCPLCKDDVIETYFEDAQRVYLGCDHCGLVFVPESCWLRPEDEKAVYDLHQNDPRDEGYRTFLSRLTTPMLERLAPHQRGLDFGCGPGPALPAVMAAGGHQVERYDPYYFNDPAVLKAQYDFICATEVVEHLRHPDATFTRLFNLLKPGGGLGIMTKLVVDKQAFRQWHYIRDPTHICFYRRRTFSYIARRFHATLELVDQDAILLTKQLSPNGEKAGCR